jgi:hypothetical protein
MMLSGALGVPAALGVYVTDVALGASAETIVGSVLVALVAAMLLRSSGTERRLGADINNLRLELAESRGNLMGQLTQIDGRLETHRLAIDAAIADRATLRTEERTARHALANETTKTTLALDERTRALEAAIARLEGRGKR